MATREENLKNINDKRENLSDEELEQVVGGNKIDRGMIIAAIEANGLKQYLVYGSNDEETLKKTCQKYGIEYEANILSCDEFKINGTWRDSTWIRDNQEETIAFIKSKICL